MIGPDDVRKAARLLEGIAHRTPVMRSHLPVEAPSRGNQSQWAGSQE